VVSWCEVECDDDPGADSMNHSFGPNFRNKNFTIVKYINNFCWVS
jgi:hypothetical protein